MLPRLTNLTDPVAVAACLAAHAKLRGHPLAPLALLPVAAPVAPATPGVTAGRVLVPPVVRSLFGEDALARVLVAPPDGRALTPLPPLTCAVPSPACVAPDAFRWLLHHHAAIRHDLPLPPTPALPPDARMAVESEFREPTLPVVLWCRAVVDAARDADWTPWLTTRLSRVWPVDLPSHPVLTGAPETLAALFARCLAHAAPRDAFDRADLYDWTPFLAGLDWIAHADLRLYLLARAVAVLSGAVPGAPCVWTRPSAKRWGGRWRRAAVDLAACLHLAPAGSGVPAPPPRLLSSTARLNPSLATDPDTLRWLDETFLPWQLDRWRLAGAAPLPVPGAGAWADAPPKARCRLTARLLLTLGSPLEYRPSPGERVAAVWSVARRGRPPAGEARRAARPWLPQVDEIDGIADLPEIAAGATQTADTGPAGGEYPAGADRASASILRAPEGHLAPDPPSVRSPSERDTPEIAAGATQTADTGSPGVPPLPTPDRASASILRAPEGHLAPEGGLDPAGSASAGSAPAGSAPAGSAPAGSAPAGSAPTGHAPLDPDELPVDDLPVPPPVSR